MSASNDAIEMARIAALAADEKLASDVVVLDVSEQLVITDCFVIASAAKRTSGQRDRRQRRGQAA